MSGYLRLKLDVFRFLIHVFFGETYCLYKKRRIPGQKVREAIAKGGE